MAKYTELLSEFIADGGTLPAEFEQIPGFGDLFIGEYADAELGYETPALFQLKLNHRAALVIPNYVERIAAIQAARANLENPIKKRVKTGEISRGYGLHDKTITTTQNGEKSTHTEGDTTQSNPDHVRQVADQPFMAAAATPPADGTTNGAQITPTSITIDKAFENDTTHDDHTTTEKFNNYSNTVTDKEQPRTDTETYNEVTDTESGFTVSEAAQMYENLEREIYNIKITLLSEFKNLFLLVY